MESMAAAQQTIVDRFVRAVHRRGRADSVCVCFVLIDVRGVRTWSRPLVILGRNAIALFVLSGLIGKSLLLMNVPRPDGKRESLQWTIYERGFSWMAAPKNASLIYSLAFLAADVRDLPPHVPAEAVPARVGWHEC